MGDIYIGDKPFMKYVVSAIKQLKETDSVLIKARGKFISKAVDVAEVIKKRTVEQSKELKQETIKISTDEFEDEKGKKINVSTIEIKFSY